MFIPKISPLTLQSMEYKIIISQSSHCWPFTLSRKLFFNSILFKSPEDFISLWCKNTPEITLPIPILCQIKMPIRSTKVMSPTFLVRAFIWEFRIMALWDPNSSWSANAWDTTFLIQSFYLI
jgi:hypothetical protein